MRRRKGTLRLFVLNKEGGKERETDSLPPTGRTQTGANKGNLISLCEDKGCLSYGRNEL